ncbi:MAG: hypothetical protein NZ561_01545, partial [Phycisphaerae bacterium]|nr:hypothetical protein [Phycisphaerae bacterium]
MSSANSCGKSGIGHRIDRVLASSAAAVAAATGLGMIGTSQQANAVIVYSGSVAIPVPDNLDGVYLNVVTGATGSTGTSVPGWDINPYSVVAGEFNLWGWSTQTWYSSTGTIAGPYRVPAGTVIGPPATNYFRPGGGTNVGPQMNLNSTDNYLGFRFQHEGNANQIHYGWVQFAFGANAGSRTIIG